MKVSKCEKVLDDKKNVYYFYFFNILAIPLHCCSPVSTSNFSIHPSLHSYVILNEVGKNERGSRRTEIAWYRTGALVEQIPIIEEEEIN